MGFKIMWAPKVGTNWVHPWRRLIRTFNGVVNVCMRVIRADCTIHEIPLFFFSFFLFFRFFFIRGP